MKKREAELSAGQKKALDELALLQNRNAELKKQVKTAESEAAMQRKKAAKRKAQIQRLSESFITAQEELVESEREVEFDRTTIKILYDTL